MSWSVWKDGKQFGPFSDKEMSEYLKKFTLSENDKVFGPNAKRWIPVAEAREELERLSSLNFESLEPLVVAKVVAESTQPVRVVDIDMPFGSMVGFMVKWSLASIPAFIILGIIFGIVLWFIRAALG